MLAAGALQTGFPAYLENASNLRPVVHRRDTARICRLALERGTHGKAFHAIAEEGMPLN